MLKGRQSLIASVVLFSSGTGWLVAHEGRPSSSALALTPGSIAPPTLSTPPAAPEEPSESLELQDSDKPDTSLAGGLPDLTTPSGTPALPPIPGPPRPSPTPSPTPH